MPPATPERGRLRFVFANSKAAGQGGRTGLAQEKDFAHLIASDKGFRSAEVMKDIHDFAVGNGALENHGGRGGNAFEGLGIEDTVAPETVRRFVV